MNKSERDKMTNPITKGDWGAAYLIYKASRGIVDRLPFFVAPLGGVGIPPVRTVLDVMKRVAWSESTMQSLRYVAEPKVHGSHTYVGMFQIRSDLYEAAAARANTVLPSSLLPQQSERKNPRAWIPLLNAEGRVVQSYYQSLANDIVGFRTDGVATTIEKFESYHDVELGGEDWYDDLMVEGAAILGASGGMAASTYLTLGTGGTFLVVALASGAAAAAADAAMDAVGDALVVADWNFHSPAEWGEILSSHGHPMVWRDVRRGLGYIMAVVCASRLGLAPAASGVDAASAEDLAWRLAPISDSLGGALGEPFIIRPGSFQLLWQELVRLWKEGGAESIPLIAQLYEGTVWTAPTEFSALNASSYTRIKEKALESTGTNPYKGGGLFDIILGETKGESDGGRDETTTITGDYV